MYAGRKKRCARLPELAPALSRPSIPSPCSPAARTAAPDTMQAVAIASSLCRPVAVAQRAAGPVARPLGLPARLAAPAGALLAFEHMCRARSLRKQRLQGPQRPWMARCHQAVTHKPGARTCGSPSSRRTPCRRHCPTVPLTCGAPLMPILLLQLAASRWRPAARATTLTREPLLPPPPNRAAAARVGPTAAAARRRSGTGRRPCAGSHGASSQPLLL